MIRTKKTPAAAGTAPGMYLNPLQKDEVVKTLTCSTDIRTVPAAGGFFHTIRLHSYGDGAPLEIVVDFGGQACTGDLDASQARGIALALLAAANDLDIINGALTLPELVLQKVDGNSHGYLEGRMVTNRGDQLWVTPVSPDFPGPGVAIDAQRDDRTPDAARALIRDISVALTAAERYTR